MDQRAAATPRAAKKGSPRSPSPKRMRMDKVWVADGEEVRGDEEALQTLADSIRTLGQLQPIIVAPDGRVKAGRRRYAAHKLTGAKTILAIVSAGTEIDDELIEIDENFARVELTALERATQLARRKELYAARAARDGEAASGADFVTETASAQGVSRRSVERLVQIGDGLSPEVQALIKDTPVASSQAKLLELARLGPAEQRTRAEEMLRGDDRPQASASPGTEPLPPTPWAVEAPSDETQPAEVGSDDPCSEPATRRPGEPQVVVFTAFWAVAAAEDFVPYADRFSDDAAVFVVADGCHITRAIDALAALGCQLAEVCPIEGSDTAWEAGYHAGPSGMLVIGTRGNAPMPVYRLRAPMPVVGEDLVEAIQNELGRAYPAVGVASLFSLQDERERLAS